MTERTSPDVGSQDEARPEPADADTEREAALIRKVMRMQERHREGGIDPDLAEADAEPSAAAPDPGAGAAPDPGAGAAPEPGA